MRVFVGFSLLAVLALGSNAVAENDSGETKLIANLTSDDPRLVTNALDDLAARPSTNAMAVARKLLSDPRPFVRKKAVRVLCAMHAPLDPDEIKAICRMLNSYDQSEAENALKALRDLNAPETIPEITPLLKSSHKALVRDACRTLAVLGNKDQIPLIEPLLNHPDPGVQADARSAIASLQTKN